MKKASIVVLLLICASFTAVTVLPERSGATTLYVGGSGVGNSTTIQEAIDDANPGDTVYVFSGTYDETLEIEKPLTLIGEDRETTVINGQWSEDVVYLSADWVNITGFMIWNSSLLASGGAGLKMVSVQFCKIFGNMIYLNSRGLSLHQSGNNTIEGNSIVGNYHLGLGLYASDGNLIRNNTFGDNGMAGMSLEDSHENHIVENTVKLELDAITLQFSNRNNISGNNLSASGEGVHLQESTYNDIRHNVLSSRENAIRIYHGHSNVVIENTFTHNKRGLYVVSFNNSIYHNDFLDAYYRPYDFNGSNRWDDGYPSGGNYWDDYNGTDNHSGPNQDQPGSDGIGDTEYNFSVGMARDRYPLMMPTGQSPSNEPPVCEITDPSPGTSVSDFYTIRGVASDADGVVVHVEVRIDGGQWIPAEGTSSWSYQWDTTAVLDGNHSIYARSHDGEDYSSEVNVTVIVHNPSEHGDPLLGQIFFWTMLVLVILIASAGLVLEARRRKRE